MIAMPWEKRADPSPEREYVAVAAHLPMRRVLSLPRWVGYIRGVMKQLDRSEGLVGYSLRVNPFTLNFWTLAVWKDESHLRTFLRSAPHADVMRDFGPKLSGFRTVRWVIAGADTPPRWGDAMSRLR